MPFNSLPFTPQGKGTLHSHFPVWSELSPYVLTRTAGIPSLQVAVAEVIDSYFLARLTFEKHVASLLDRYDGKIQPICSLQPVPDPKINKGMWDRLVDLVFSLKQMHFHMDTCHKGKTGELQCREARPATAAETTGPIELFMDVETLPPTTKRAEPKQVVKLRPHNPRLPVRHYADVRDKFVDPLPDNDPRLLYYKLRRELITPGPALLEELSPELQERLRDLATRDPRNYTILLKLLKDRNGFVVETSPVIAAVLGCNSSESLSLTHPLLYVQT